MAMRILDLDARDQRVIQQIAEMLVAGFATHWPDAWPDVTQGLEEVNESFAAGRLSLVALDEQGAAVGWIGGRPQYHGRVWELHPLVVRPDRQGQGIGRALVRALEERVAELGGLTLWLGSDDLSGQTSLSGVNLYANLWTAIQRIANPGRHPYEFYQKLGFTIVGVLPDANGPGKPDIFLAKRVAAL